MDLSPGIPGLRGVKTQLLLCRSGDYSTRFGTPPHLKMTPNASGNPQPPVRGEYVKSHTEMKGTRSGG
jgi:hypothetical protein